MTRPVDCRFARNLKKKTLRGTLRTVSVSGPFIRRKCGLGGTQQQQGLREGKKHIIAYNYIRFDLNSETLREIIRLKTYFSSVPLFDRRF